NALTPQTVTVTGVGDAVIDGDVAYTVVTSPAVSGDPAYNGLDPPDVAVVNRDTACSPNPNVRLTTARQSPGRLSVTVTAVTSAQCPPNPLQRIVFGTLSNARIEVGGQPIDPSQPLVLAPGTTATTFTVVRIANGQAATAPFTVVDTCGSWRTFVGGG